MAKLYWRVKRDGKWTWIAVQPQQGWFIEEVIKSLLDYDMILPLEEEQ